MGRDWDGPGRSRGRKPKPPKKSSGGGTGTTVGMSVLLFFGLPVFAVVLVVLGAVT